MEQCLQELGYALVPIKGSSMWPLLKEGSSSVQVAARDGRPLRVGDVVLYRREDGTLVLHRIVRILEEGTCLLCGDHQWQPLEQVTDGQILGVAERFFQNGRTFGDKTLWYRLYRVLWNRSLRLRRCFLALLRLSGLEKHFLS